MAHEELETNELLQALKDAVRSDLSRRQHEVPVAVALEDVPIDVLAQRLGTSRGALYKTLHDARRKRRAVLAERGISIERRLTMGARGSDELLGRMLGPEGPELTCEECFARLDEYVEIERSGSSTQAEQRIPGMGAHLQGCPACSEDHDSLLAFLASAETDSDR